MSGPKPYPENKGSGVEWMGRIPIGWSVRPFFSVAKENRRSNKGMVEDNLLSLSYGQIVRKDISSNDGLLPDSFETYQRIQANDIVLRLTDLQNDKRSLRSAIAREGGIITSAYLSVRAEGVDAEFLAYALRDCDARKVFYSMGGGLRQSMKFSDMKWLPIAVPPFPEQRAIASYLDHETAQIDEFIGDQEELIELLKERRAATIAQAVTKGLDLKIQMKDSGAPWVGKMPEHWMIVPIKWKSRLVTGITPSTSETQYYSDDEDDFQWIRPEDLDETGQASRASKFLSPEGETRVRVLPPSTVLLCCIGATLGKVGITDRPAATNQQITAVVSGDWLAKYLFYSLQASRQDIEVLSVGNTLPILNNGRLGSHLVPMPSREEQQEIADYLDYETAEIDAALADAMEAIELSKERRAALISAAVTGKIDVRNHTTAELGAA